jgi:NADPH:quinone reductase-like Zn-dependent oxidoreductase
MRAWQVEGAFGLGSLREVRAPSPTVGPGEVRVAVRAVSLNYRDLLMIGGQYNPRQPLPLVPGSDAAGEVVEVGPGATHGLRVGDRVMPIFAQDWLAGEPERAMMGSTLGGPLPGILQEERVVPGASVVRVPDHLTWEEAATLPCAGVTAWRALVTQGRIKAGEEVLTQGTGGVSTFALQIAVMHGARVTVTSSSDAKLERARAMGAAVGINYRSTPDWGRAALAATEGRGFDHVMELGGAGTLDASLRAVRPGGRVHLIGVLGGVKVELAVTRIFMQGITVGGVFVGARSDLVELCAALRAHPSVRPLVDRVFDFHEVPQALGYLASGAHQGKVVVRVA